jgi:16S rRNA processing protein RimM
VTEYLRVGFIARPHGLKGAVKLDPLTDDVSRFKGMQEGYLELHGDHVPVRLSVLSVRPDAVVVQIEGYETVEESQTLRGGFLCVNRAHAARLPAFTYFIADLIGLSVSDTEGKTYGKITDVLSTGANDVYVIDGGKLMVPALKKVIERVDVKGGEMVFKADILREVGLFAD